MHRYIHLGTHKTWIYLSWHRICQAWLAHIHTFPWPWIHYILILFTPVFIWIWYLSIVMDLIQNIWLCWGESEQLIKIPYCTNYPSHTSLALLWWSCHNGFLHTSGYYIYLIYWTISGSQPLKLCSLYVWYLE